MRISDWSSDVCSSDLLDRDFFLLLHAVEERGRRQTRDVAVLLHMLDVVLINLRIHQLRGQIPIGYLLAERLLGSTACRFQVERRQALARPFGPDRRSVV